MSQRLNNLGKKKRKEIMTFSKEKGLNEWSKSPFWAIVGSILRYLKSIKHIGYSKAVPCVFVFFFLKIYICPISEISLPFIVKLDPFSIK